MATGLLNCTICPKKPSFSDTSHLLTHVSSKGHLSHLHKLEVRSHGEPEAGRQLARYNHWYREHDLAELLSDRMQQKLAKQMSKRVAQRRRATRLKQQALTHLDPNVFPNPFGPTNFAATLYRSYPQDLRRRRRRVMLEEMNDPTFVPTLPIMSAGPWAFPSSPLVRETPTRPVSGSSGAELSFGHSQHPQTPDSSKLKGQVWPGMDMFDSATEEMARKRNQKKDGTMINYMRINSAMIEPFEVTFSPGGTLKRRRHMDDLDDDDNLLDGESPTKKQMSRRKRKVQEKPYAPRKSRSAYRPATKAATPSPSKSMASSSSLLNQYLIDPHSSSFWDAFICSHTIQDRDLNAVGRDQPLKMDPYFASDVLPNPFMFSQAHETINDLEAASSSASWPQLPLLHPSMFDHVNQADPSRADVLPNMQSGIIPEFSGEEHVREGISDCDETGRTSRPYDNFDGLELDLGPLSHVYAYTKNSLSDSMASSAG